MMGIQKTWIWLAAAMLLSALPLACGDDSARTPTGSDSNNNNSGENNNNK